MGRLKKYSKVGEEMQLRMPHELIEWSVLDSGLRVITIAMPNFHTVSAGLFAKVGSRYESRQEMGISHFIEHLLFKGSRRYSARKISEIIEGRGGFLNAYTSEESTCFYFKTLPYSFFESLDVLVDLYTQPLFDPEEIAKEKDVVIEELHSYEDQPSVYIDDLFGLTIWNEHPLGNLILGLEENIARFTEEEIRRYFRHHYTANNTVLAVAGKIEHQEVLDWVKKEEGRFFEGGKNRYLPYTLKHTQPRLKMLSKELEQCYVQMGFPCGSRYSDEQWALRLLNTIIGENMSSRLFQEIREKQGLAYHVSSAVDFYEDIGSFSVQCGVDPDNIEKCVQASLQVLQRVAEEGVQEEELMRAKNFAIGQALQDMESTLSYMLFAGDKLLSSERDFSTNYYCEQIGGVSVEEVQLVAKNLFQTSCLNLALIGPYNRADRLMKQII